MTYRVRGIFCFCRDSGTIRSKDYSYMYIFRTVITILAAAAAVLGITAFINKPKSIYRNLPEEQNPLEGKRVRFVEDERDPVNADGERGHLEIDPAASVSRIPGIYEYLVKPCMDRVLSFLGLVVLSPVLLIICAAIYFDDPGPVLFIQKRTGKNKRYFRLHKFRSMKMSTPHDVPTHMLQDPESYITRVGKFLRKTSLDELPQLWDIFIGNMSVVGPRPGLWNQDVLTAKRDLYGANDCMPGLSGWAQINGRDELELDVKAKYDGEYCRNISFRMDATCVLITLANVLKHEGVVEGGTGMMKKHIENRKKEIEEGKQDRN